MVFDIASRESFDHIDKWHQGLLDNANPTEPETFPIILVGNKADRDSERQVTKQEAEQWTKEKISKSGAVVKYIETSAPQNTGIQELFVNLARATLKNQNSGLMELPKLGGLGGMDNIKINKRDDVRRS